MVKADMCSYLWILLFWAVQEQIQVLFDKKVKETQNF